MSQSKSKGEEPAIPDDIAALSFEAALQELKDVVQRLEKGEADLEESIDIYSRGTNLKRHCETKLRSARERVDKLIPSEDGTNVVASEPLDVE